MSKLLFLAAAVCASILFSSQAVEEVSAESRGININTCGCPIVTACHLRCRDRAGSNYTSGTCHRHLFGSACKCHNIELGVLDEAILCPF
ncbi:hypothetical protein BV898_00368 [Hypsibius exemplaris]|uniref:Invertebrate defensins family profile domain-containing protein n=1 Tax=Hypsibius exemplaris TaxID=2072580 RepID=A0A1W0XFJ5_HYPEX|nr:hypothetical protein BV898_00368 [Hypsibius exemplaris]